jgi:hypothetical protein
MAETGHPSRRADRWRACALVVGTLLVWWLHVIRTAEQPNGVGDLVGYFGYFRLPPRSRRAAYAIPNVCCPSQLEPSAWLPVIGIGLLDVVEGRHGPALLAVALAMVFYRVAA